MKAKKKRLTTLMEIDFEMITEMEHFIGPDPITFYGEESTKRADAVDRLCASLRKAKKELFRADLKQGEDAT